MIDPIEILLNAPLIVINVGLDKFAKELETQGVEVTRVAWIPPAGGDQEMIDILDQLI